MSQNLQFGDSRDQLFPDLHADGVLTQNLAAEMGQLVFYRATPCATCGGHEFWRYPDRTKQDHRDKPRCVNCKKDETYNNRATYNALKAKRRAALRNATPAWLTKDQLTTIKQLYQQAVCLSDERGVPYHVDHIVPLTHDLVCGLHVPWNLEIKEASINSSKCNRFDQNDAKQTGRYKTLYG